jgi:transposase InsO family protein
MPWKETCVMDQKMQMIGEYLSGASTVTELSRVYGVSRNTVYKWIRRYQQDKNAGLGVRTSCPRLHPNATSLEIAREIITLKRQFETWGPKKLVYWLKQHYPDKKWPAVSTAGTMLKKAELVKPRKRRWRTPSYNMPFQECHNPNSVWSADYKGQFKTGDNKLCYPLTISDNYSRYLLACVALEHPTYEATKPIFESAFKKYGIPAAIRTDNGTPFASTGLGGLSLLSVWFIKLGIKPERIKGGHPEENGRHERMHKTLKAATAKPPKENQKAQQKAFNAFRLEYDEERPHEALSMQTPATCYKPSLRAYNPKPAAISYRGNCYVRQVRHNGEIKWKGEKLYVSQSLCGEPVALRQKEKHTWEVYFSKYLLGILDELEMKIKPHEKC